MEPKDILRIAMYLVRHQLVVYCLICFVLFFSVFHYSANADRRSGRQIRVTVSSLASPIRNFDKKYFLIMQPQSPQPKLQTAEEAKYVHNILHHKGYLSVTDQTGADVVITAVYGQDREKYVAGVTTTRSRYSSFSSPVYSTAYKTQFFLEAIDKKGEPLWSVMVRTPERDALGDVVPYLIGASMGYIDTNSNGDIKGTMYARDCDMYVVIGEQCPPDIQQLTE